MSPHAVRGTGTRHTVETVERGRERGWEGNCLRNELPHHKTTENASCTYAMPRSTSTWNSDTCAYVSTSLTSRGTQALFVVNSLKLRLTVYNEPSLTFWALVSWHRVEYRYTELTYFLTGLHNKLLKLLFHYFFCIRWCYPFKSCS